MTIVWVGVVFGVNYGRYINRKYAENPVILLKAVITEKKTVVASP